MTHSISRGFIIPLFLLFGLFSAPNLFAVQPECPVCGMTFKPLAKTAFLTKIQDKPRHLCSFACAAKTADKAHGVKFEVADFNRAKMVDADNAYFLIRSKNLLKELDFDMPPTVVAFASEKEAKEKAAKLGDGEVIHGWKKLKKTLAP